MASSFQTFFRSFNPQTTLKSISHSSHSKLICMQLKPNKLQPISTQTREIPALVSPIKLSNVETKHTRTMDAIFAQHSQKLELFRNVMRKVAEIDALDGLNMIDAVQRLGIDYHFQAEIDEILNKQMNTVSDANNDLHEASLRFRLMRQHGYFVPEDVFNNFRESNGMFKQDLAKDIKGLMSLYEASQLAIEGEDTLIEAENFSGHLLRTSMFQLDHHQARMVANTLSNPHHKSLASFMVKNFLKSQATNPWLSFLKEAANTDFYMVKLLHQNEIIQISKWWNELGLAKELKFARDQPLKWYIWSLAGLKDPKFSEERVELTKSIAFIYLIDDIFDVYGTLDELILFTEAVNRWEISAIDHLPDYMKKSFKALYDMTDEISCKVFQKHGWNPLKSLKMTWASLCNAFLVEAKWFASGQLPKSEEYLKNGIVSSGVNVVLVHLFFLLGQNITGQSVELLNDTPSVVSSVAAILRLWDDLGSAEDENQDGNDGSYVRCYLKEHEDCSIEEAREKTRDMIADEWKKLNKELLSPNPFPATFTSACLDLARMVPLMYSYDDNQCLPSLQEYINLMLHETVSME